MNRAALTEELHRTLIKISLVGCRPDVVDYFVSTDAQVWLILGNGDSVYFSIVNP